MSLRAVYPVGNVFKKVSTALKSLVDQVPLIFQPDKFSIEALSPDKVSMIIFELPSSTFEEYNITEEIRIIADRDEFIKSLKRATKRDKVIFEYSAGSREITIRVVNIKSNIEREYLVPLTEVSFEKIGELDIELEVTASLPTSELINIIKDATVVGDEITLIYSSETNSIKVSAHSELAEYTTILKQFQPLSYLEATIGSAIVKYSVDHLKALTKILDLADECTIAFGPDKPLRISFEVAGGGRIIVWIAPRG